MNNIIKRVWIQNRLVNIEDLTGMVFQAEIGAHTFEISGIDDTGAAVALSGTVSGVFRRPDNADIALIGSASDGVVSVTLSEDCYAVPGRFGLTIFVTSNSQKVAVYACVGTVAVSSTGNVAGDTPASVEDLIDDINAAIADLNSAIGQIPASYANVMAAIAPTYSGSALYSVGSYAWYNGSLYRCTTAITTAETWTAAHWTQVALGKDVSDLKSAIIKNNADVHSNKSEIESVQYSVYKVVNGVLEKQSNPSGYWKTMFAPVNCLYIEGVAKLKSGGLSGNQSQAIPAMVFIDENWNVISATYSSISSPHSFQLSDVPSGSVYVVCQFSSAFKFDFQSTDSMVQKEQQKMNAKNLAVIHSYSDGYVSDTGVLSTQTAAKEKTTDYIPITANAKYTVQQWGTHTASYGLWQGITFYTEDKTFISPRSTNQISADYLSGTYTAPATAYYMRVSFRQLDDVVLMVESGSIPSFYRMSDFDAYYTNKIAGVSLVADDLIPYTKNDVYTEATLLMGKTTFIEYDSVNGTITIPDDFLILRYKINGNNDYKSISGQTITNVTYAAIGTSAVKIVYNTQTSQFQLISYATRNADYQITVATIRLKSSAYAGGLVTSYPWKIDGKPFGIDIPDKYISGNVLSINHRGWHQAPENTLPAYKLSRKNGFTYVETDVQFTSDGVPVLLHDLSINRTARNADGTSISSTVNISDITYEQALEYDFGIYKGASYAGTPIPKFEDFIKLCRALGLHAYIELKADVAYTQAQIESLIGIVERYGMKGNVTWISVSSTLLGYVKNYDSKARLGIVLVLDVTSGNITTAQGLKTADNEVFLDVDYTKLTSTGIGLCYDAGTPLEAWTVDTTSAINGLDAYITGVTSDNLIASEVLYNSNI